MGKRVKKKITRWRMYPSPAKEVQRPTPRLQRSLGRLQISALAVQEVQRPTPRLQRSLGRLQMLAPPLLEGSVCCRLESVWPLHVNSHWTLNCSVLVLGSLVQAQKPYCKNQCTA